MNKWETLLKDLENETGLQVSVKKMGREERYLDEITKKKEENVTGFSFTARGEKLFCFVEGTGKEQENYCALLKRLLLSPAERTLSKSEHLLSILSGEAEPGEMRRFAKKYSLTGAPCFVLVIEVEKNGKEAAEVIAGSTTSPLDYPLVLDEKRIALFKFLGEGDSSPVNYADFLAQFVFEEVGIHPLIGVSGVADDFSETEECFLQAEFAVRMSKTLRVKGEVHSYKEFLLVKMLEEIPLLRRKEYLREFLSDGAREILEDNELLDMVEEFFSNNLNLSETARKLFMHRNTLSYRLDKIERETGLDIRRYSDAISFRVLTNLYQLQKAGKEE